MISTKPSAPHGTSSERKRIHLSSSRDEALESTVAEIRERQKEKLVEQTARERGLMYINLQQFPIPNNALQLIERALCEQLGVVCFYAETDQIRLAALDPLSPAIQDIKKRLELAHHADIAVYFISEDSLATAFRRYDAIPKPKLSMIGGIELSEESIKGMQEKIGSIQRLNELLATVPVTEVLTLVISSAIKAGASDIHIEAEADDIKIRLRIDGVLHDIGMVPKEAWGRIISRIKLVSGLKINILSAPQDGRFTIYLDNDKIEVRVSTVPTSYGESVVMRLLRFSASALDFDNLGLSGFTYDTLKKQIDRPNGMIISTGPTGSGKTTTLYAILHKLNNSETKILTLEDPIEYKIKGINQSQVNIQAGLDFAKGLRSLLRQDPDIIMVGEIRDLETADTAINAALTGHLVLSTLHTNSSAGAIPRFLAMGSKNFLLAPAINAIIGQRLVRRLCATCKKETKPEPAVAQRIIEALKPLQGRKDLGVAIDLAKPEGWVFYEPVGCDTCNGLGYKGRIGIFEILTMNKEIERLILRGSVSEYDLQDLSMRNGMITMLQDGILKAILGVTSLAEIFRQAE